jgi:hypothetical protein
MQEVEVVEETSDPRLWKKDGWIARIIKNEDDEGWAVEITRQGESEPSLVTHWTMGRDKKNPKPLDHSSFATIVKTASEIIKRHEQSARAKLHRTISYVDAEGRSVRFDLDIVPDDDDPHAIASAYDERTHELIRQGRTSAGFKLNAANASRFVKTGE